MTALGLDGLLVSAPENIYYLIGLDHQGYFAFQLLVVPLEGEPVLITRAMERATVRDQVSGVRHMGYSDGVAPLPEPADRSQDVLFSDADGGSSGLRPWGMSSGVAVKGPVADSASAPVTATLEAIQDLGLTKGRLGVEMTSTFFPYSIANGIISALPDADISDASDLVADCRLIQSPLEIDCTRQAAKLSDSMMLAAIAAAGSGVSEHEIMAVVYDAMFRRGGTYPGFIPLVRSTRTIEHEHGTWGDGQLKSRDILFVELAGCVRRYHAPMGRLVFIDKAPPRAERIQRVCEEAMMAAAATIRPGVRADTVYQAWQNVVDRAELTGYSRHHCGYSVGIGFPPSWSGAGTPRGLRRGSDMELKSGMVFHLMSWLLRTGRGDSFLSDTILVTDNGCEFLTNASRAVTVR